MIMLTINPNPLMTRYLVKKANAFEAEPFIILDIGARGGFNKEWEVFADQCRIYCFEPDQQEFERLHADAPPHVKYIPIAVGGTSGITTLYETKLGASTGLYRTNMDYFGRLLNRDNAVVIAEHHIEVKTLNEIMMAFRIPLPDFIKLDVEGAEVDVLKASGSEFHNSLLGVLSEFRFQPEINGSPTFASLDALLVKQGFRLFDMHFSHQSRRKLPYPGLADYRLPSGEPFYAYTTHGQIQDGDALYLRDLLLKSTNDLRETISACATLKLCTLFELYSLNDCAAELIIESRPKLSSIVDCDELLNLLATGINGKPIRYQDYLTNYFSGPARLQLPSLRNSGSHSAKIRAAFQGLKKCVRHLIK